MTFDPSVLLPFLSGLGVGGAIAATFQHWLARRGKRADNLFSERKVAFDHLLTAYAALAEGWSDQKAKQFALCEARVQLVASNLVIEKLARLKATNPESPSRKEAFDDLLASMRKDLDLA